MSDISGKLTQIAAGMTDVYNAGYTKGKSEGGDTTEAYNQGVADGKQVQNNDFWQSLVKIYTGTNTYKEKENYNYTFFSWNDDMFYPTVKLYPDTATNMFAFFNQNRPPVNLKERLIVSGGELDFSRCTIANGMFSTASISVLPIIDFSICTVLNSVFSKCKVESIEKVVLKNDGTQTFPSIFNGCSNLKEIRFEGVIGTSISFAQSPLLSADSVADIIAHLGTITTVQTITFHADVSLTDEQKATIQGKGWTLAQ